MHYIGKINEWTYRYSKWTYKYRHGHIDIINGHTCSSSDTCGISFCTIRTRPLIFNKILSNFSKLPEPKKYQINYNRDIPSPFILPGSARIVEGTTETRVSAHGRDKEGKNDIT